MSLLQDSPDPASKAGSNITQYTRRAREESIFLHIDFAQVSYSLYDWNVNWGVYLFRIR